MTRPNSLPLLPPWGVQSCFFVFFWFLVFWFVVGFFEGLAKQHKIEGPRPNSLPVLASSPTLGVANLLLIVLLFALGLWFH